MHVAGNDLGFVGSRLGTSGIVSEVSGVISG